MCGIWGYGSGAGGTTPLTPNKGICQKINKIDKIAIYQFSPPTTPSPTTPPPGTSQRPMASENPRPGELPAFQLGSEECGRPILSQQKIHSHERPDALAHSHADLAGVVHLRGV